MLSLVLYGTSACHLCEQAEALILEVFAANSGLEQHASVEGVDVVSSHALVERYGPRLPVLVWQEGSSELDWPFDQAALVTFINDCLRKTC